MNPDDLIVLGFLANVPLEDRVRLFPLWMLASDYLRDLWAAQREQAARERVYVLRPSA